MVLFGLLVIVNMALFVLKSFEDIALLIRHGIGGAVEIAATWHVDINMALKLLFDNIGVYSRGKPWIATVLTVSNEGIFIGWVNFGSVYVL